jgi:hypothetical protein
LSNEFDCCQMNVDCQMIYSTVCKERGGIQQCKKYSAVQ